MPMETLLKYGTHPNASEQICLLSHMSCVKETEERMQWQKKQLEVKTLKFIEITVIFQ